MLAQIREQLQAALSGDITVERELGGGGMSRVFLATDRALNRQIVIKTLPPELASAIGLERFRREIEVAARLQHPHIVPLIAAGVAGASPYFTMPFVEGESLRDRLMRDGALPVAEVVQILREVADALSYAHGRGVVHRDIKPENILVANRHALVTDFGVAKAIAAANTAETMAPDGPAITLHGVAVGTPAYMAPEQVSADPTIDHRADLYSLGIVGYEMLVGTPPFTGLSPARVLAAHISTEPSPIHQTRPEVPEHLAKLIVRCLAKSPNNRPSTAAEVCAELETIASETAVRRPRRRRRAAVIAVASMVGVLLLGALMMPPEVWPMVKRLVSRSPAVLRPNLVIVAPFENETGDSTLDRFGGFAAGQIADALSRLNRFEVVEHRSAVLNDRIMNRLPMLSWFGGGSRAIADQTGAGVVVTSKIYGEGDSLRIRTRIKDYGSDVIRRPLPDVVGRRDAPQAMITELTNRVYASLLQASDTNVIAPLGSYDDPPSIEAYDEMMKGFLAYVTFNPSFAMHYRRAEALDSQYVTPVVLLALSATFRDQRWLADSAVVRARRMSGRMTPAELVLLEHVEANLAADGDGIFRTAQQMLTLVPGSLELPLLAAGAGLLVGRPTTTIEALNRTDPDRGLNLVSPYYWRSLGEARHQLGEHEAALEAFRAGLRRYPNDMRLAEWEATELVDLGRDDDTNKSIERGRVDSARMAIAAGAADALVARGRPEAARRIATRWLGERSSIEEQATATRYNVARLFAAVGRWDSVRAMVRSIPADGSSQLARDALTLDAIAAIRLGDTLIARRADSVLLAVTDRFDYGRATLHRARLAAQRGERRRADELLSTAMRKGFSLQYTHWPVERDPYLVDFRSTEWFNARAMRERFAR